MIRVLVIGGTGFIGYHFIKLAKKKGYKVTSLSLHSPKKIRFHANVKYIKVDISNYKDLKKKLNGEYDYVLNAGGYGQHSNFGESGKKLFKSHVNGLLNILNILPIKKLKKFIQIGSSAEYGKNVAPFKESMQCFPETPYALSKYTCSKILIDLGKERGFPSIILRLFQVYGPSQDQNRIIPYLVNNCLENNKFKTTKGKQINDFCYIDDVISAIFKSFKLKNLNGEVINIGSGKSVQIKKLIIKIKRIIGKGKPIFGAIKYRQGIVKKNYPSINMAKKILNWTPKTSLNNGIKKTIKSYK